MLLPSGRLPGRNGRPRERRGATLVFVAVLSVALVGIAAFTIDISRLYMGVNELQTRADATALNAALLLQRNPSASQVTASAAFGASNAAFGSNTAVNTADVQPGTWNPTNGTFTNAAWIDANAVRVSAGATPSLLFGRFLSSATQAPVRRAIAWVANVNGVDCLRPWGISQSLFQAAPYNLDLTTQAGINALRTRLETPAGIASVAVVLTPEASAGNGGSGNSGGGNGGGRGGGANNGGGNNSVLPGDAAYQALTGDLAPSPNNHAALIRGAECGNGVAEHQSGKTFAQPSNGAAIPNEAGAIVQQDVNGSGPCRKIGATDATCFDPVTLAPGPMIVVPLTVPAAMNGQPNNVRMVTLVEFRLMCAFTSEPQGNPLGPSPDRCPWLTSIGRPEETGFRRGTIVGYPVARGTPLAAGTVLGNTKSTGQRLILVQ